MFRIMGPRRTYLHDVDLPQKWTNAGGAYLW